LVVVCQNLIVWDFDCVERALLPAALGVGVAFVLDLPAYAKKPRSEI
jgi:hypothetical protein